MSRTSLLALACLSVGATGCRSEQPKLPGSCRDQPARIAAALRAAPAPVRLADGTRLSTCLQRARSDAELEDVGITFTHVADGLATRVARSDTAALQLGYLIAAARRGAQRTNGVAVELQRRLEQSIEPRRAAGGAPGRIRARRRRRQARRMRLRLYHHPDGARIAYREAGSGPPVALLHSATLTHREFEPLVEHLSDRFRLVLPDLPLHGDSEDRPRHSYTPDWLADVIAGFCRDTLGPRPLVGGHDVGAELLLRATVTGRLRPRRLVLMSSRLHGPVTQPGLVRSWRVATRAGALPGLDRAMAHGARLLFRPRLGTALSARRNPAAGDLVRHAFADVGGNGNLARSWARAARSWPLEAQPGLLDAYASLDMPTLLLWADEDRLHPLEIAEEALARLPDGQLRVLPGHRLPDGLRRPGRAGAGAGGIPRLARARLACSGQPRPETIRMAVQEAKQQLWGAETTKAIDNFPVSGDPVHDGVVHWLGRIKAAAARVNGALGLLDPEIAERIARAGDEVAAGKHDDQFPVDAFQTGSGTSSNTNANEVIAALAGDPAHPNDHVNMGQSSNDVFPTAVHLAALELATDELLPALERLERAFADKAEEFKDIVKAGRTHLMDAVPVTLGQEFAGYAAQVRLGARRVRNALPQVAQVPLGGTATGTGLNTHPEFAARVRALLSEQTGLEILPPEDPFEAQGNRDALVELSGALKVFAVSVTKIANDLAMMGSGPRAGFGELLLPELQKGSSIMPGKVNPVIPEVVMQVAAQVIGNDTAITVARPGGQLRAQRAGAADRAQPARLDRAADREEQPVRREVRPGNPRQRGGRRPLGRADARRRHRAEPRDRLRQGDRDRQGGGRLRSDAAGGGARAWGGRGDLRRDDRPAADRRRQPADR